MTATTQIYTFAIMIPIGNESILWIKQLYEFLGESVESLASIS